MAAPQPVAIPEAITALSDEEFERRTLEAIGRELGLGGLARFIRTYRSGNGDYTAERHQWLDKSSLEDILADLKVTPI